MKTIFEISGAILGVVLFLSVLIGGAWWLISLTPPFHMPVCTEWQDKYYWTNWMGDHYFAGTTIDEARKLAGDKPLTIITDCIKSN